MIGERGAPANTIETARSVRVERQIRHDDANGHAVWLRYRTPLYRLAIAQAVPKQNPPLPRFDVASIKPVLDWQPPATTRGERGSGGGGCPTSMKAVPSRVD